MTEASREAPKVTVPYCERRHRLNQDEIEPVRDAALARLLALVKARDPERLGEARALFRVWFRIHNYVTNRPDYPPHDTWDQISTSLGNGTVPEDSEG